MKIYKTNLQELLNEAKPPFYICNFSVTHSGQIPMRYNKVTVAAFNEFRQPCELLLSTEGYPVMSDEHRHMMHERANKWEQEIRTRLTALGLEIRDGKLSEEPVIGCLD